MDDVQRTIETVLKKERTIKTVLKEARAKRDAELAALRADLAEARADVARFEAALDAANRELAQARATTNLWLERIVSIADEIAESAAVNSFAFSERIRSIVDDSGQQAGEVEK